MFIVRFGSVCTLELHSENMPSSKKRKTDFNHDDDRKRLVSKVPTNSEDDFGLDWREKCKNIYAINHYALRKCILTDVTFIVGQEAAVCHAHRLILALGSPVFEAMFYGGLAEKGETITIPDIDPDGFRNLLKFMYSDSVSYQNDVEAFKTYFAADKYCVSNLKEHCEKYLLTCKLSPSNVWVFLESSLFLNSQAITAHCLTYLKYHTESALKNKTFLDVTTKTVETLLGLDVINISEIKLLFSVVRWAEYKSSVEQTESFQNIITPLLKYMRFGALTPSQFINFLETKKLKDLLKDHDALAILKHIIQPLTCPLPDWCCSKIWRGKSQSINKMEQIITDDSSDDDMQMHSLLKEDARHFQYTTSSASSHSSSSSFTSSSSSSDNLSSDSDIS